MKTMKTTIEANGVLDTTFQKSYLRGSLLRHLAKLLFTGIALLLIHVNSFGQVRGVWGDPGRANPQKMGETYVGFVKGNEGAPTGISAMMHLNQRMGIHFVYGMDSDQKGVPFGKRTKLIGVGLQPRLNFRNRSLNGAYYLNISAVGGGDRMKYAKEYDDAGLDKFILTEVKTECLVGAGVLFEVYKKYQVFVERNYVMYYKNNAQLYTGGIWQTSFGIRVGIF